MVTCTTHHGNHADQAHPRRVLLWSRYFELWVMFDDIDTDDDRRVSYDEFVQGLSKIETWGVKYAPRCASTVVGDSTGGWKVIHGAWM